MQEKDHEFRVRQVVSDMSNIRKSRASKKKKKATHTHGPEVRNSLGSQGTNSICLIICSVSVCPAKCRPISSPSNSEFLGLWIDVEGEMGSPRWGVQEIDD